MSIKQHIPNLLTSLNVLCGVLAVFFALNARIDIAIWLIFAGALFDFSDGFAARLLKAYSNIGKELDSLADLISFGAAPAAIWSTIIKYQLTGSYATNFFALSLSQQVFTLLPFIMVAFAAFRLAKFNVDTRQTENFLGLTTTATGIFTAALAYKFIETPEWFAWMSPLVILALIVFFSIMLISEVPMFSLKFKNIKWANNKERFTLLFLAIVFVVLLGVGGIAAVILYYIIISLTKWLIGIK
ncbi:CDP-alcohol phosphatidyltransferase family protein [Carboxylicivirga mesophila]|uniref:CDP-alcohol phosphatidyltransferase family protein n=1 Tax=Carboxylicivirga mesophila TaxID=1166478 RepID=A0ABS5K9B1_9BACT|nr:CDP-alcohol phosphatidyltransferase family protein [Carboxylicivirga mesophila]MBS2211590.1 CDP-alcohol phosphatidyltransferase family protein [Carboxylicivirga mesophila]